jgi:hypothetical protein
MFTQETARNCGGRANALTVPGQRNRTAMTGSARLHSRPASARQWITTLALLAFFLQSLTLQTHIHPPFQPATAQAAALDLGGAKVPLKSQDPVDQCRLCQELVNAGAFIAPTVASAAADLSFAAVSLTVLTAFMADPARAFAWRSRAPPRR